MSVRDDGYERPGVPDELKWAPVLRGFPEDVEVLSEWGWVPFRVLWEGGLFGVSGVGEGVGLFEGEVDWRLEHKPLREGWGENRSKHMRLYSFSDVRVPDYAKWRVGGLFPRVVCLDSSHVVGSRGGSGGLVLVRPEFMTRFSYGGVSLVHVKRRGVDLVVPRFTDLWVRNRFQSRFGFGVADGFVQDVRGGGFWKGMVNRFEPKGFLGGFPSGEEVVRLVESGGLSALVRGDFPVKVGVGNGDVRRVEVGDVYRFPPVRDEVSGRFSVSPVRRESVECFNLVLPAGSSHTLVVRREGRKVEGEFPRWEWVGFPVVVGDGYDKSRVDVDRVNGLYG